MDTIQIRINPRTKKSVLSTENGFTPEKERSMLHAVKEAENNKNVDATTHNWQETNAYLNEMKKINK